MPLVIISGFPCAGKTYRAHQLLEDFRRRASDDSTGTNRKAASISLVSDESLGVSRAVYASAAAEKDARAAEMSAVKRALTRDDIVLADGLNYIKGFRYQLYCEAKAMGTPSCVVHVGTPAEQCRAYHEARKQQQHTDSSTPATEPYADADFENLIYRYEEPNGMSRWDSPLFIVLHDDPTPPLDAIWAVLFPSRASTAQQKPSAASVAAVRPNTATVLPQASGSDFLYALDKLTSEVVAAITAWQGDHGTDDFGGGEVPIASADAPLTLPAGRRVTPAELQRLRRGFVAQMRRQGSGTGDAAARARVDKDRVKAVFVDYLNDLWERE